MREESREAVEMLGIEAPSVGRAGSNFYVYVLEGKDDVADLQLSKGRLGGRTSSSGRYSNFRFVSDQLEDLIYLLQRMRSRLRRRGFRIDSRKFGRSGG